MASRNAVMAIVACLLLGLAPAKMHAGDLRIAAWNLEHLAEADDDGCIGRSASDYATLAGRIAQLGADIVAFQEVENVAAARRVFPERDWRVEVSRRPPPNQSPACWDRPESNLGHLATGFAIRRGIEYRRNDDVEALGNNIATQRWGVDITVTAEGRDIRLLSVHLASGCWGEQQDADSDRRKICATLRAQMTHLGSWADERREEGMPFVILGDFNRRLALPGDWAWHLLSPPSAPLSLPTEGVPFRCDPRFTAHIDHLVAGGGAEEMLVEGSFRETPRIDPHPDHCAVSAKFRFGE